jgi:hypothetical protein
MTEATAVALPAEAAGDRKLAILLAAQPEKVRAEIIRISTDARPRALQVALLVPILAALLGLFVSFRMLRMPDPAPSSSHEGMDWG